MDVMGEGRGTSPPQHLTTTSNDVCFFSQRLAAIIHLLQYLREQAVLLNSGEQHHGLLVHRYAQSPPQPPLQQKCKG